jgi:hypothetical protein
VALGFVGDDPQHGELASGEQARQVRRQHACRCQPSPTFERTLPIRRALGTARGRD